VSATEKRLRLKVIEELQEKISGEINEKLQGQSLQVLVEGKTRGKWRGRTRSDKLVFFSAPGDYFGRLASIVISKASAWSLQGVPAADPSTGSDEEEL
jgi:tRNA-2-methylthio-N6-dimethylallyladenosine synthase